MFEVLSLSIPPFFSLNQVHENNHKKCNLIGQILVLFSKNHRFESYKS